MTEIEAFQQLCEQQRFSEALPLIEALVTRAPHIDTSWFNYGYVLSSLGRSLEAAEAYLKAAQLSPQKRGLFSACLTLARVEATERLFQVFSQQLEQDPWMLSKFKEGDLAKFWVLPKFVALEAKHARQAQ